MKHDPAFAFRRLAEKNIPNCAADLSKTLVQIQGARQAHEPCNCRATHKLDDKDKQVGIFFDRNRLRSSTIRLANGRLSSENFASYPRLSLATNPKSDRRLNNRMCPLRRISGNDRYSTADTLHGNPAGSCYGSVEYGLIPPDFR